MTNFNTFFENTKISSLANLKNEPEKDDVNNVVTFDDMDDFNENFGNLMNIKKQKNIEKNILDNQISQQNIEINKKTNFESIKNVPIITKEFAQPKNINSKIDNLFQDFKGSSLFGSVIPFQNNTKDLYEKDKFQKAINTKLPNPQNNFSKKTEFNTLNKNMTTRRNRNLNTEENNRKNIAKDLSTSSTREEFGFERNKKRALNSSKEICNLISKPSVDILNEKKERLSNNKEMKNYSNMGNINKNSRYNHLMNKSNTSFIDNNASININNNSILNKNMKCPNQNENIKDTLSSQNNTNYSFVTSSIDPNVNYPINRKNFMQNGLFNYENDHVNLKTPDKPFISVKEFAYKEEMNPKFKNSMEDFVKIIDNFNNSNSGFFGLFDGHGGDDPVKYTKENISKNLEKIINERNCDIEDCLKKAFLSVDEKLKFYDSENSGLTSTVILIEGKILHIANVGDSGCFIISRNKEFKKISVDHTCSNEKEVERIINNGGKIINNRVFGQLMLTRALGDHALRKCGVIPEPYTNKIHLTNSDKYVLIASDGIWDVLKEDDIKSLLVENEKCEKICENLIQQAMKKGSKDNISCILIKLN